MSSDKKVHIGGDYCGWDRSGVFHCLCGKCRPLPKLKNEDTERNLIEALGEVQLKEIGEQIAEVIRKYNLQMHPEICRKLFNHLSDVIEGWGE